MQNVRVQLAAAALIVCFGASMALACIPEFPWQLLNNRADTLDTMPLDNRSFAYAETHLFRPLNDKLTAEETDYGDEARNDSIAKAVGDAEVAGLASEQADVVRQMRAETSGDSAFDRGAILPAAVRLYTAGAIDFHKGNTSKAIARFEAVLRLPAEQRQARAVWAAYMLGRIYAAKGNVAEASHWFDATRDLVNRGAPDPLGLGVSSFGEEARIHLKHAESLQKLKEVSPQQRQEYGREIVAAVRLYAEQAAHGSTIGVDSLRQVIDEVIADNQAVAASICDPMVQQLLVNRTLDGYGGIQNDRGGTPNSQLSALVTSVQKCGSGNIIAADRLAAIAYRGGDYQLAHTLASQMTTPLAMWIQARLAMQKGDAGEAAKYYAAASKAFPAAGDTNASDEGAGALLVGENSVLTLSRGEYLDALEQLYPYAATFWGDVAYIAERVLTVDELKTFVDTHKDTQLHPEISLDNLSTPPTPPATNSDETQGSETEDSGNGEGQGPADWLPNLLARRLVRAGRYQEALKYFSTSRAATSSPSDYVQALADANSDKSKIDRARAWYRAATLAGRFKSGNEIMGTEGSPDYYMQPALGEGIGPYSLNPKDQFVTDGEYKRFEASAAKPDFRYHYLFVGVDNALRAAALLPPRSQAYAAVICRATRWMMDGKICPAGSADLRALPNAYQSNTPEIADPITADLHWSDEDSARITLACQLYQRYLKEGAVVPWAIHFGRDCPDPDFDGAVHFVHDQEVREAGRRARIAHHRRITAVKLALILAALAASTWWFVRHRYA